jgi:hypothetical protein
LPEADCIHAPPDPVEATCPRAVMDGGPGEAKLQKLPTRYHAMLARREPGKLTVCTWMMFVRHLRTRVIHVSRVTPGGTVSRRVVTKVAQLCIGA